MELIRDDMDIDWDAYGTEPEHHLVKSAAEFTDATIEAFYPTSNAPSAPEPLWKKCAGKIAFRKGEVSLWAGVNGHGKSMMLSQVELDLATQGQRVLSMSFEMLPVRQMQRKSCQAYGDDSPSVDFIRKLHAWTQGKLWIYDRHGSVDWRRVVAVMRYAHDHYAIDQFVVDSLMKCVKGEDDYNGQKDFVDELCTFAQARQVHVHLVHHVRKGESEHKAPGKFDVRGAGSITDQVDNVFIVWRNKKLEGTDKAADMPGAFLICEKQRNGDFEGSLGFWFDRKSMQYLDASSDAPIRYNLQEKLKPQLVSATGYRHDIE